MTWIVDHVCGFEIPADFTQASQQWSRTPGGVSSTIGSGQALVSAIDVGMALSLPSGGGIRRFSNAGSFGGTTNAGSVYTCFAVWRTSHASGRKIFTSYNSGTPGINYSLNWKTDGTFELFDRAGVSKGVSSGTYSDNTRQYIELSVDPLGSTSTVRLYVNGSLDKTFTNVDTRANGTASAMDSWQFGADGSGATTGDDIFIDDVLLGHEAAGTFSTKNFGNLKVEALLPTSDTATLNLNTSAGSTHYSLVDDIPPDTADYVKRNAANGANFDLYGIQKASASDTSTKRIYGVEAVGFCRGGTATSGGAANERMGFRYGGGSAITISFNGNGVLDSSQDWLYNAEIALPNNAASDQSASPSGIVIDTMAAQNFGPMINGTNTITTGTAGKYYSFALDVAKDYYLPSGWRMGVLAFN